MLNNQEKYLFSLEPKGIKLGLERTKKLLKACGSPHKNNKIIQIVGTNGKGSTSAILAKLLHLKYKIGLYTSPHLYSFRERIRINGNPISSDAVSEFIKMYKKEINSLDASFFEVMTVMAIWYFNKSNVDYAIMETGLGGQFDSVTACKANLFGFTSISKDHSHILGNSLLKIGHEKVAAIHPESKVYSVIQKSAIQKLIEQRCNIKKCNLQFIKTNFKLDVSLPGNHQKENASLALAIAKEILQNTKKSQLDNCLMSINWHGRNQKISTNPDIIFDVAHNIAGIQTFLEYIKNGKKYRKKTLLFSVQKRKEIKQVCAKMDCTFNNIIYSRTNEKYSMPYRDIKQHFKNSQYIENPDQALKIAIKNSQETDLIAIVGTHYWGDTIKTFFNICFDNI